MIYWQKTALVLVVKFINSNFDFSTDMMDAVFQIPFVILARNTCLPGFCAYMIGVKRLQYVSSQK